MRMMFPKPRPNFLALFGSLNIPLFDDHRLHIPSMTIFMCWEKRPRRRNVPGSVKTTENQERTVGNGMIVQYKRNNTIISKH